MSRDPNSGSAEITFSVEYAATSRSGCKGCKAKIEEETLRFGIWRPSRQFDGKEVAWYHQECFRKVTAPGSKSPCYGTADLAGVATLRWDDTVALYVAYNEIVPPGASADSPLPTRERFDIHHFKLHEQSRMYWALADTMDEACTKAELKALARANDIDESRSHALAKCVLYGVPPLCPDCGSKALRFSRTRRVFVCGAPTQGGKCGYTGLPIGVREWLWPDDAPAALQTRRFQASLADGTIGALFNEFEAATRVIREERIATKAAAAAAAAAATAAAKAERAAYYGGILPLTGLAFVIAGKPPSGIKTLTDVIVDHGGRVTKSVSSKTQAVIAGHAELLKPSKDLARASELGTPVVDESYIDACIFVEGPMDPEPYLLKPPCSSAAATAPAGDATPAARARVHAKLSARERAGLYVVRDASLPGAPWCDVVLQKTEVGSGTNAYYHLQLLCGESGVHAGVHMLFMAWGRVGTNVGSQSLLPCDSARPEAIATFAERFEARTGNVWADGLDSFALQPGKYALVRMAGPSTDGPPAQDVSVASAPRSSLSSSAVLDPRVAAAVAEIFAPEAVAKTLAELHIDTRKMPIKSMSSAQVLKAYKVLDELAQALDGSEPRGRSSLNAFSLAPRKTAVPTAKLERLSSLFYTIVPHDFGMDMPPVISSTVALKAKLAELQALQAIVTRAELDAARERAARASALPRAVAQYLSLPTRLVPVPENSVEARVLSKAMFPGGAVVPGCGTIRMKGAFKIQGVTEPARPVRSRRMLLWHGSRTSNVVGILADGRLRIAPPQAPHAGYNFGKGVYASDVAAYAASYAKLGAGELGFVFGVELELGGAPLEARSFSAHTVDSLAASRHTSVIGRGGHEPTTRGDVATDSGVTIRLGPVRRVDASRELACNEYVVYAEAAAVLRYVIMVRADS
ncbi:poly-(ADP-ribose) polymerase [Thecamonas trahens ATCC 50062]|uniref:Poly [ADP-ribose] polymerase n=1 Tax=Thecamonas trahens ATCC 50062 TaxID=461836 RepID=A0A0L0DTC5_THETB|nr:poly-(ADP-ribose) polymerase [Thecamonas trahens ATCC 50062]KNC55525.1 poly-(ADP-ribose) polymerase [Thecamonas trahens ATCC 50062]|eukprot:XP_013761303.1 poly-(ADP-ribose) polymerase [Thecamonas trahens ATCC 50062]